jgi:putative hydrolase of the HAD superfamily
VWPELCEHLGQKIPFRLLPLAFQSTPANKPMFALAEELKRRCVVGIITDNKKDRIDYLRKAQQLDSIFAPIVVSAETGCTKKGKRMFEVALQLSGVGANEAVFIDNSTANLVAPRALGMHAIHFDDATNDVAGLRRSLKEDYDLLDDRDA